MTSTEPPRRGVPRSRGMRARNGELLKLVGELVPLLRAEATVRRRDAQLNDLLKRAADLISAVQKGTNNRVDVRSWHELAQVWTNEYEQRNKQSVVDQETLHDQPQQ